MSLQGTIDQDIKSAMLAKDSGRLRGLRAIKAALLVAKTEKGASDVLTDEAEIKVLQKLVKQRRESADIYLSQKRDDLYQIEVEEMQVIEKYLPKQMSRDDVAVHVKDVIARTGAAGIKDMGKVMGQVNKELAGQADGKTISEVVKELLA
ncbi:MAG: GatB/YqeY domain-containing protein [Daejeonella sp.]|uniref:GatB/YqeY domain-containing protein n=1 Tax=Daejeonella sp. JGW-45 TaxID=3034148 RepID=UPI0023ED0320|nr:GatB/YqeY domain-containing protein [Daejeonella sp. JGW-45]